MENNTTTPMHIVKDQTTKGRIITDLFALFWKLEIRLDPTEYNTPLNDLGVDSLDYVELVLAIEQYFSITIPDNEFPLAGTFNEAVALIEKKLTA